ncbi:MAG TPA: hypothetical protein H9902_08125 [Candidatus Stackebrandtia faecavium]|nr:hypothetical protein [Candidatus Stackebrandtia faecavium]
MVIKLSEEDLDGMSKSAGDVEDKAKDAGKVISKSELPAITGWLTLDAIKEVNDRWDDQTKHCADRWLYFSGALSHTADHVVATDEENAFYLPTDIPGEPN